MEQNAFDQSSFTDVSSTALIVLTDDGWSVPTGHYVHSWSQLLNLEFLSLKLQ